MGGAAHLPFIGMKPAKRDRELRPYLLRLIPSTALRVVIPLQLSDWSYLHDSKNGHTSTTLKAVIPL